MEELVSTSYNTLGSNNSTATDTEVVEILQTDEKRRFLDLCKSLGIDMIPESLENAWIVLRSRERMDHYIELDPIHKGELRVHWIQCPESGIRAMLNIVKYGIENNAKSISLGISCSKDITDKDERKLQQERNRNFYAGFGFGRFYSDNGMLLAIDSGTLKYLSVKLEGYKVHGKWDFSPYNHNEN